MTKRSKYSLLNLSIWIIVTVVFFVLFFSGDGPESWGTNKTKRFLSALLFAVGFISFFIIQFKSNKETIDERVRQIQLKATSSTLIIILMYVFIFGISLYTFYDNKLMPSSWMYLLTYSVVFLTYIVNSGLYIFFEKRETGYGS